ncbi:hypothetical protein [Rubeoparvulum massiliense]|uniref:hypothetical protein n=1 Tax=Rubeoparvulum massiliense TaxID=1631346 RepID=UPI00065E997A|nr:hypothetical protein [Rubeoparvulum massiliense]
MELRGALLNWLQISVVVVARPDDQSAQETQRFFREVLREDFQIQEIKYERDPIQYTVHYLQAEEDWEEAGFDRLSVESLIIAIQSEPRYNNQ